MATPHNLPPNPNQAPVPGSEPLPQPGAEWRNEINDRAEFNTLISGIQEYHNYYNRHFNANGVYIGPKDLNGGTQTEIWHTQNASDHRAAIEASMDRLFSHSNADALIAELNLETRNSKREDQHAATRHAETLSASLTAQQEHNAALVTYRHNTSRGIDGKAANGAAARAGQAAYKAQKAFTEAADSQNARRSLTETYQTFVDTYENRQEQSRLEAEQHIAAATRELDSWAFEDEHFDPAREARVRDSLTRLNQLIDDPKKFSMVSKSRAVALAQAVRLRHRLDSRCRNNDALTGNTNHDLQYMPDGGILHSSANNLVTYGDGSQGVYDPATRSTDRRFPDGSQWYDQRAPLNVEPRTTGVYDNNGNAISASTAFAQWERTRQNGDADVAHAALNYEVTMLDGREQQILSTINAHEQYIAGSTNRITEITKTAADEGRTLTRAEQTEISDIHARVNHRRNNVIAPLRVDLGTVRESSNAMKYRKNLLEVDRRRVTPEQPPQTGILGRVVMRQNVNQAPGNIPPAPNLLRDGSILVDTFMNGRRGNWQIWPGGYATLGEQHNGKTIFYNKQGQPI